jgi:chloramphenicol-sensitive protein RarD
VPTIDRTHPLEGIALSLTANLTWAAQVLYWPLLKPVGTDELLAYRIAWSSVVCLLIVLMLGRRRELYRLLRSPRTLVLLAGAGACLTAAWGVYIYAVTSSRVVESSLGLFLIPLATALVGVVIFGERLRPVQWMAVIGAALATVVLAVGYGRLPWIALVICSLMAAYAVLKKRVAVPAISGFTAECLVLLGPALMFLAWLTVSGQDTAGNLVSARGALIAVSGLITAIPLICHAATINILPLVVVGVLQYLNPTLQFLIGIFVRHEAVDATRWIGFALIWSALLVFIVDSLRESGKVLSQE